MTEFPPIVLTSAIAVMLAAVHLFSPYLVFLDRTPRSIWLSLAGGVSVAYVIVHLLPELAALQEETHSKSSLYAFALIGLVIFYGLERLAKRGNGTARLSLRSTFWLHLGSFALYNFLIGYLLDEQAREEEIDGVVLYAVAMGLHFVVNDRALYAHHGAPYLQMGRWVLSGAAILGWIAGIFIEIPLGWLAGTFALLAGSVILNVIKEELPEERESRFWAFALGAAAYATLLQQIAGNSG